MPEHHAIVNREESLFAVVRRYRDAFEALPLCENIVRPVKKTVTYSML